MQSKVRITTGVLLLLLLLHFCEFHFRWQLWSPCRCVRPAKVTQFLFTFLHTFNLRLLTFCQLFPSFDLLTAFHFNRHFAGATNLFSQSTLSTDCWMNEKKGKQHLSVFDLTERTQRGERKKERKRHRLSSLPLLAASSLTMERFFPDDFQSACSLLLWLCITSEHRVYFFRCFFANGVLFCST